MTQRLGIAFGSFLLATIACDCFAEAPVNQLTEAEQRSGWKLLFDGQSTEHFRNYKKENISDGWQVSDGAIVRSAARAGDIITKEKFGAFELSIDYKISKGGNSGIMFHVVEAKGPPWNSGPEIQVQDNIDGHDPQLSGWLYQMYKPGKSSETKKPFDATRPAGQWNQLYIRIAPDGCEVCMNGVRYYQFKMGDDKWNDLVAASKFARYEGFGKAGEGHICLQDHGNEVAYRNIKVRELGEDGSVPQPIDGELPLTGELAFPNLKWDQWSPVNDEGKVRELRLIELTYANDDSNRLYAASQYGEIWSFENKTDVTDSHLLLDLHEKVVDWKRPGANEQGLLGLAMHPDFKNNGFFFVYYSAAQQNSAVVSRFSISKDDPNKADPESEQIVLEIEQPFANHNGGAIEFGPDGFLYIGVGDGGFRNDPYANGQNRSTLLGSILRIDVDRSADDKNYGIPADNPFVENEDAAPEIFAYGIRNPWRIAFDSETGDLWCGDVGQELWEEVNVITKGGNYGWNNREGFHPFGNGELPAGVSEPIDPIWEYDHRIGRSITGGRVYRSSRVPELAGKYLYADYVTGTVWALSYDRNSGKATRNEQALPDSVPVLAFGEDQNGEVYYLTSSTRGECIYRFESSK